MLSHGIYIHNKRGCFQYLWIYCLVLDDILMLPLEKQEGFWWLEVSAGGFVLAVTKWLHL